MNITDKSYISFLKKNAFSLIITTIFIFLAVGHVVVPGFKIDTIGLTLLGIAFSPWLLPYLPRYLESIKIGDNEFRLRKLEEKISNEENQRRLAALFWLRDLKYDLGAFIPNEAIGIMQKNTRENGLQQNPYLVYVKPSVQGLLANTSALEILGYDKIKKLASDPELKVAEIVELIDGMINEIS